jgi:hypothetical protein
MHEPSRTSPIAMTCPSGLRGRASSLRVAFTGRLQVRLDELGDWESITGAANPQLR